MSASTQTPWPLTGKTRLILRIFWVLLTLFLLSGYAVAFSENLADAQRGMVGIMFDKLEDGSAVVMALYPGGPAEQAGVKVGDRLLQIDGLVVKPELTIYDIVDSVRGETGTKVSLRIGGSDHQERAITILRGTDVTDLVLVWTLFAQTLIFLLLGLILFLKQPGSGYALFVSLGLIFFAVGNAGVVIYTAGLGLLLFAAMGMIMALFILLTFPNGKYVPLWSVGIGVLGTILYGLSLFPLPLDPYEWPWGVFLLAQVVLFGAGIACQVFRYRRIATPAEKRQLRLVFWGAASMLVVYFLINSCLYYLPNVYDWLYIHPLIQSLLYIVSMLGYLVMPVTIVVSMLKNEPANS